MFGGVGCGKTMLMDMFYDNIDSDSKLRIHFHDFMLDVHERIHKFKSSLPPSHVKDVRYATDKFSYLIILQFSNTRLFFKSI